MIVLGLPQYYKDKENLGRIVSYKGKFSFIDMMVKVIEWVAFARVLIDTDITQKYPRELKIEKPAKIVLAQAKKYE